MNHQQSNNLRTSINIFENNNLLTFDNNHPSRSHHTFVNSTLANRNNQTNDRKQAQAQDLDIFELILQKIVTGFKEVIIEVAAIDPEPINMKVIITQAPQSQELLLLIAMLELEETP
ncbi:21926_t:CDS:2 [Cetraspora pellucida]|uniref:21926_t:CDS:1 n=1 Tax=Cetraspora pellucida TaxID=1433469 RepID=A0A9N9NH98_9GLOM|nr:21926_t:CDS:2 [Cetraspora pellucida]